jgi:glycosyltransferase involved in cell wall biosynthesis
MISFIVIGKNEGWRLTKCLQSIYDTIEYNGLKKSEIIYVDSKSSDDSIKRAKAFTTVNIFEITGECNAAIARNIGANEAAGDILFFTDGDMEINKDFLSKVIINSNLKYDYVTGHLDDYLYDYNDRFLGKNHRTYGKHLPKKLKWSRVCGGVFLIKKHLWDQMGGMRTKYKMNEDFDLSIRLKKEKNIAPARVPALIAKHHTVDSKNDRRMWNNLMQGYFLYKALLLRDHFFNKMARKRTLRANSTVILLLALILSFFIFLKAAIILALCYVVTYSLRATKHTKTTVAAKNKIGCFLKRLGYLVLHDIGFLLSFMLYYPSEIKLRYKVIP